MQQDPEKPGIWLINLNEFKRAKAKSTFIHPTTNDSTSIDFEAEIFRLNADLVQTRRKLREAFKRLALQDRITETLRDGMKVLPVAPYVPIQTVDRTVEMEHSVLLFGDPHIGEDVSFEQVGGINNYNFGEFVRRLQFLADTIIKLKRTHLKNYNLPKLWILGLGDFVCGTIHNELIESSHTTVMEWCLGGATVISQFIRDMAANFEEVEFVGVVGNHGRMTKEIRYKNQYVNWDHVLYQMLTLALKDQSNVKFDLPKCFYRVREINGHKFLILHGDNIRGWAGIPWYGIDRAVHRLSELLASQGEFFEYVAMGHFHNTAFLDRVKGEKIINGSFIGGNEYSLGKMFTSAEPKQVFMGIHKRVGVSWRFPINLKFVNIGKEDIRYQYNADLTLGEQSV